MLIQRERNNMENKAILVVSFGTSYPETRSKTIDIIEEDLWVQKGGKVESFEGANNAIGSLVLRFRTSEEMEYAITHQREWLKVIVK